MLTIQQLKKTYTAEQVTLVLLARLYFNTITRKEVVDFITETTVNWPLLYKITRAHGLRSFVHVIIKQHAITAAPQFEGRLQKSYNKIRHQNLTMAIAAAKIISDLKERGIVIIPYKGPFFAHSYYGDIALRESTDLDFLVAPNDVDEIENYFISNNYSAKTTVPKAYLKYYTQHFKDIVYRTPGNRDAFSVEMHWRLMEKFSGDYPAYDFFLPHLQPNAIGGLKVNKLSPTYDLIAVISNHFVKDMSTKFKYMVDVACLIHKEGVLIDKRILYKTATRYGFKKRLQTGLALTENLLGVKIDNEPGEITDVTALLPVPLAFPLHLQRLYINEPKFIKRSLQLQDNNRNKLKFISKIVRYAFLPTYEDINQQGAKPKHLLLLSIARPFRLFHSMIKPKKL
ncbi:nucleotidyltransferase domain-containing protein [Mucilaginibacter sp. UYCu711]|uniref:nucleotidyltransferase domain-containing protein n=1 Tax=Mucilaginibacter sp. UYCu711 TaxID=3156339 RepID=UPI003D1ECD48